MSILRVLGARILPGFILLLLILLGILQMPAVKNLALTYAAEELKKSADLNLTADELDYSFFLSGVTVRNMQLKSSGTPNRPPLLTVEMVEVRSGFFGLLGGLDAIDEIHVRQARAHFVRESTEETSPLPASKDAKVRGESQITLPKIPEMDLEDIALVYEDETLDLKVEIPSFYVQAGGGSAFRMNLKEPGTAEYGELSIPLERLSIGGSVNPEQLILERFDLGSGGSSINASGDIRWNPDVFLDLKIESNIEAYLFAKGVSDTRLTGAIHGETHLQGPPGRFVAGTTLKAEDLKVNDLDAFDIFAQTGLDQERRTVKLERFKAESESGRMEGSGLISWNVDDRSRIDTSVSELDLSRLMKGLGVEKILDARVDGSLSAHWPGFSWEEAEGSSTWNFDVPRQPVHGSSLPVSGRMHIRADKGSYFFEFPGLRVVESNMNGGITIHRRNHGVSGELDGSGRDLGTTLAALDQFFGWDVMGNEFSGPWNWNATLNGSLSSPEIAASVFSSSLSIGTVEGGSLEVRAQYGSGSLNVTKVHYLAEDQFFFAEGSVTPMRSDGKLNAQGSIENLRMETITSLLRFSPSFEGILSADWIASGSPESPEIRMNVDSRETALFGNSMGSLVARATYRDGWVDLEDLQVKQSGGGTLDARGRFRISGDYEVEAIARNLRWDPSQSETSYPIRTVMDLNIKGAGNFDDPQLIGQIAFSELDVANVHLGSCRGELDIRDSMVRLNARLPSKGVALQAEIGTRRPFIGQVNLELRDTELERFAMDLRPGLPLRGKLRAVIEAEGDFSQPEKSSIRAHIDDFRLDVADSYFQNSGPILLEFHRRVLKVHPATLRGRATIIRVDGSLPLDGETDPGGLQINANVDLPTLSQIWSDRVTSMGEGYASIRGVLRGSLKKPVPDLIFSAQASDIRMTYFSQPIDELNVTAEVKNRQITLRKLNARIGAGQLSAQGLIPINILPRDSDLQIHAETNLQLEASRISPALIPGMEDYEGSLGFRAEVRIPENDITRIHGMLEFHEADITKEKTSLRIRTPTVVNFTRGIIRLEQLVVVGPDSEFRVQGSAGLEAESPLDLHISGKADSAISGIVANVQSEGKLDLDLHLTGTWSHPQWKGSIRISDGQYSIREPNLYLSSLTARLQADGDLVRLVQFSADLNGGALTGEGVIRLHSWNQPEIEISFQGEPVYLNYPMDLQTVSKLDVRIYSANGTIIVGGKVVVTEGGYVDRIDLADLTATSLPAPIKETKQTFLDRIQLDLSIETAQPIAMKNNLGRLAAETKVRLIGTATNPGMQGTVQIEQDSELYVLGRTFIVNRGILQFSSKTRIEPIIDFRANTTIDVYNIRVLLSGNARNLETTFHSDPPLPEEDIYWVLLTGRAQDVDSGFGGQQTTRDPSALLAAGLTIGVSQRLQRVTGTRVNIEYDKFTSRGNPGQWLTLSQPLTGDLKVAYSNNLKNSDQIWEAEYRWLKKFQTSLIWETDSTQTATGLGRAYFGGKPFKFGALSLPGVESFTAPPRPIIRKIRLEGELILPENEIRGKLKVKDGDRYQFLKVLESMERIRKLYANKKYLEARIRFSRSETSEENGIELVLEIVPGPQVEFTFSEPRVLKGMEDNMEQIWYSGVFERQRADDAVDLLRRKLVEKGFARAAVDYEIQNLAENRKRVHFRIEPGNKFESRKIRIEGVHRSLQKELEAALRGNKLDIEMYIDPEVGSESLEGILHAKGNLDAQIQVPVFRYENGTALTIIQIVPGPSFRIGMIEFSGNQTFDSDELKQSLPVWTGDPYTPSIETETIRVLEKKYFDLGYRSAIIEVTTERNSAEQTVNVSIQIQEGRQNIVDSIEITGHQRVSEKHIRGLLRISEGEPESAAQLADTRKLLYDSGGFNIVEIYSEPVGEPMTGEGQLVRLKLTVSEPQRFQLLYGGYYNTDRGPGLLASITQRNLLGGARSLAFQLLLDGQRNEERIVLRQPLLGQRKIETSAVFFRQEDDLGALDFTSYGIHLFQNLELRKRFLMSYGYRYEKLTIFDVPSDETFVLTGTAEDNLCDSPLARNRTSDSCDLRLAVAALVTTLTRDTRDNLFDATRGSFTSQSVEWDPGFLGGDLSYVKYYSQYFKYFPLSEPSKTPFHEELRSRFVFATGIRLGLAGVFNDEAAFLPSERFFAGGTYTVRGFSQNSLGPQLGGAPLGGEAMLVLNNELRFPLWWWFDGVAFLDIGQVYLKTSDFRLSDLRETAGFGLRLRNPFILLRFDYGWKLDRREGESSGHFHFSIAQAF